MKRNSYSRATTLLLLATLALCSSSCATNGKSATKVAAVKKQSPRRLFDEANQLYQKGRLREAIEKLEKANAIQPGHPGITANLAHFYGAAGKTEKAVKYFEILARLEPANKQAAVGLGMYRSILEAKLGRFAQALKILRNALSHAPRDRSLLWNGALFAQEVGRYRTALKYLKRLQKQEPSNMHLQSKLIQAYQGLNRIKKRDAALKKILRMYKNGEDPRFMRRNRFCREQYRIGEWKVFVFQYFRPGKKDMYFYEYSVHDSRGRKRFWLSLGSYDSTTRFARESGRIPGNGRMYHLDYYEKGMHSTKLMSPRKPGYDSLRKPTRSLIEKTIREKTGKNGKNERGGPRA